MIPIAIIILIIIIVLLGAGTVWAVYTILNALVPLIAPVLSLFAFFGFFRLFKESRLVENDIINMVVSGIIALMIYFFALKSLFAIFVLAIIIGIIYLLVKYFRSIFGFVEEVKEVMFKPKEEKK